MSVLNAAVFQRVDPLGFQQKFLEAGFRSDGRSFMESRNVVEVAPGVVDNSFGSASARIGNTTVIVSVTGGIFVPVIATAEPQFGKVSVGCDYSLCLPGERRASQAEGACISHKLDLVLNNSDVFDKAQLSIGIEEPSHSGTPTSPPVWDITLNVLVVRDEGSVLDCVVLAAVGALRNAKLPAVNSKLEIDPTRPPTLLLLKTVPVCFTFCMANEQWLADPSKEEESVFGRLTIVMLGEGAEELVSLLGLEGPGSDEGFDFAEVAALTDWVRQQRRERLKVVDDVA